MKTIIELREEAIKEDKNPEFYLYQKLEEKDKEIERLTAESTEWESKCYKYQDIINELKKYVNDNMQYYDDGEDCGVDCCIDGFEVLKIIERR